MFMCTHRLLITYFWKVGSRVIQFHTYFTLLVYAVVSPYQCGRPSYFIVLSSSTLWTKRKPKSQRQSCSHRWVQEHQVNSHNMHTEDLMQTHAGPVIATLVSVSSCEPCLVDSVGHVLLVSSIPPDSYTLLSPSSIEFSISSRGGKFRAIYLLPIILPFILR